MTTLSIINNYDIIMIEMLLLFFLFVTRSCKGSGKTFTIEGGMAKHKGIIPRAAEMIFQCKEINLYREMFEWC